MQFIGLIRRQKELRYFRTYVDPVNKKLGQYKLKWLNHVSRIDIRYLKQTPWLSTYRKKTLTIIRLFIGLISWPEEEEEEEEKRRCMKSATLILKNFQCHEFVTEYVRTIFWLYSVALQQ
jgi:hypothetical protein